MIPLLKKLRYAMSCTALLSMNITIYTDGACKGNPGRGGWGALAWKDLPDDENETLGEPFQTWSGGEVQTTNNRMEMMAPIIALESLLPKKEDIVKITIITDSVYVFKGITEWLMGWIARGWRTSTGAVKNEDLWRRLHAITKEWTDAKLEWKWVKGHAASKGNHMADELACKSVPSSE